VAALAGPFLAITGLLGAGGAVKVHRPDSTARALREMGVPAPPTLVRLGAGAEVAIAAAAVTWASPPFVALVALSYLGFAGFVLVALRRGVPLSSCGCFGVADTPPTYGHLALDLAAAAVAVAALGSGRVGLGAVAGMDGSLVLRGAFVVVTVTTAWFAYVALTLLPQVVAGPAGRQPAAREVAS